MSTQFNLAIVGVSSGVGNEILRMLEERSFPLKSLRLFDLGEAAGDFLECNGDQILVEPLAKDSFRGIDLAFFASDAETSRAHCLTAVAAGAVCIDCSGGWSLDPDVPLLIPEVNADALAGYRARGIVANPTSASIALAMAMKPLHDRAPINRIVTSTYQAVSEVGPGAIDELRIQSGELLNGRPTECKVFAHQMAYNCLPQVGAFLANGYTGEEMLLGDQLRRILGSSTVGLTATAVMVPVFYGQCMSVNVETETKIAVEQARELLAAAPGVEIVDDPLEQAYPMPLDAAGQDEIFVGRIREDMSIANGLNLWLATDGLRKGAATNALQIAELLAAKYL